MYTFLSIVDVDLSFNDQLFPFPFRFPFPFPFPPSSVYSARKTNRWGPTCHL